MPLNIAALMTSPGLPGAGSNGALATPALVAQVWAAAVGAWATGIVPPSATVAAAQAALQSTLAGLFATDHPQAALSTLAASLESAHLTFATAVGGGMAGYAPVPPVAPIGFLAILTSPARNTSQLAADAIADALDVWMRTGIATLVAPPFTVVPWS